MSFRDHVGHRRLLGLLTRTVARGALPPSLVFAGPEGVGKRRAALALAQLCNCLQPVAVEGLDGPDGCGACPSCRRIARGVHADVLLVGPGDTGSIKVDQARQIVERSAYRPFEGRRRVVIIEAADAMEVAAQNALLKTLEEPPAASTFVLVTARPDVLLPTVLSRCQRLRFGRLSPAEVAGVLQRDHGFTTAAATAAAALAGGSAGRALECDTEAYGDARARAIGALRLVARSASEPRGRLDAAKRLGGESAAKADREQLGHRLRVLSSMLRDLSILASGADDRWLTNADERAALQGLAGSFDRDRSLQAFEAVDRALAALDRNASSRIVADWLAFQI